MPRAHRPPGADRVGGVGRAARARAGAGGLWQSFAAGHREDIVDAALRFFFSPATCRDHRELLSRHRANFVALGDASGMVAAAQAATSRDDVSSKLGAIRVPTLVVAGRDDIGASGPAEAERMVAAIPGARLAIVENANHMLALERPREFVELVSAFVRARG